MLVTHEHWELALALHAQLTAHLPSSDVVVVANTTGAARRLRDHGIDPAEPEAPQGYGANLNLGMRRCPDSDLVLLLNDDLELPGAAVDALVAAMVADPGCAVAGPRIVDAAGAVQPSAFRFPSPSSMLRQQAILPGRWARWPDVVPVDAGSGPVDWVLGAAMVARRSAIEAVGGFDERYFLYSEETDLALRLHRAGWRVRLVAEATATHLGSASTGTRTDRLVGRARRRYARTHWRRVDLVVLDVGAVGVQVWNAAYTAGTIALRPSSARARLTTWMAHWRSRTLP